MREQDALQAVGTKLTATTAREAFEQAGLANWNVRKEKMRTSSNITVPDRWAVVYDKPNGLDGEGPQRTYMNTCGRKYTIVQNEDHAEFLDALVDFSGGHLATATSFKNNKIVYMSIKLPDAIQVAGTDRVDLYLNAINSFDGTTPFMVNLDPVRMHCANQLNYFRNKTFRSFKIRHTQGVHGQVQKAREALGLIMAGVGDFEKEVNRLAEIELTDAKFEKIVEDLYPRPEKRESQAYETMREEMTTLYRGGIGENEALQGTAWGGFNAVVEWLDWYQPVRGSGDETAKRAQRIMTAANMHERKADAYDAFAALA